MTGCPSVRQIQSVVAHYHGRHPAELRSHSKERDLCWARHVAVYISRRLTHRSLAAIARLFGDRDPSTLSDSVKRVETTIARDPFVREEVSMLMERILKAPPMTEPDALTAHDVLTEVERHLDAARRLVGENRALLEDALACHRRDEA